MPDPNTISNGVLAILLIFTTLGAKLTTDQRKKRRQMRRMRDQVEMLMEVAVKQRSMLILKGVKRSELPPLPGDPFDDEDYDDEQTTPSPRPIGGA